MILTFAAKIQHFKKEFFGDRASAYGAVRAGKHGFGAFLSLKTLCFYRVIPFAVKYYRSECLSGLVLDAAQLCGGQSAKCESQI